MVTFNVNRVNGKWIIGTDNVTNSKNGITNWDELGSILSIPSLINGYKIDEIGRRSFFNCIGIEEIVIGDGIKQINE